MGMTIAEAIEIISDIDKAYRTFSNIEYLSLSTAIDTMRKYQKIAEIVKSNPEYIHHTDMDIYKVNSIREVIEDGKID